MFRPRNCHMYCLCCFNLGWCFLFLQRKIENCSDDLKKKKKKVLFLVAQRIKRLPAMQEPWVRFLGQEDPLEKEMATHSSILAWRIPWTEEPGRL